MARIRTIKPEFWTSEQVLQCSRDARLLFVGLWQFSDDFGRHTASAITLKAEVFPGDDILSADISRWLGELIAARLVQKYTVDGKDYLAVTGWHKHQKIDRPQAAKHPAPPDFVESKPEKAGPGGDNSPSKPRAIDEYSTNDRRKLDEGSSNARRAFATESSRVESKGEERKGEESSSVKEGKNPKKDDDDDLIRKIVKALGPNAPLLV